MQIRNDPAVTSEIQLAARSARVRPAANAGATADVAAQAAASDVPPAEPERVTPETRARSAMAHMHERVRSAKLQLENRIQNALEQGGDPEVIEQGRLATQALDEAASSALAQFHDGLLQALDQLHAGGTDAAREVEAAIERPLADVASLRESLATRRTTHMDASDLIKRVRNAHEQIDLALQSVLENSGGSPKGFDMASFSAEALRRASQES